MRAYDVIKQKRDGGELTADEINFFIKGISDSSIADYQTSALLMAIYNKGMTTAETVALTKAMTASGTTLDTSGVRGVKTDKHSTGGVGDKVSLVLAPLMATMGVNVPMISGRGLGHTGGTLDKLASIPGMRTDLGKDEAIGILKDVGMFIMGQTDDLAPADRKLYALRDVTATVDSIPLIASSIMSKKLAEGVDGMVFDIKVGTGAFMKDEESARLLGRTLIDISKELGVQSLAVLTSMDWPIGRTIGNALELKECITMLRGKGANDLREIVLALGTWMLFLSDGISEEFDLVPMPAFVKQKYMNEAAEFITKGDAYKKFLQFVDAQGGDVEAVLNPAMLPTAKNVLQITAGEEGCLRKMNAETSGQAAMILGAGRQQMDDEIDHSAGIVINKKPGDNVAKDDIIAMFHYNEDIDVKLAEEVFRSGIEVGQRDRAVPRLIKDVIL